MNITSLYPIFTLSTLLPGNLYIIFVYASNLKGCSDATILTIDVVKSKETQLSAGKVQNHRAEFVLTPFVSLSMGLIIAGCIAMLAIIITLRTTCTSSDQMISGFSHEHNVWDVSSRSSGSKDIDMMETDEINPDVIPELLDSEKQLKTERLRTGGGSFSVEELSEFDEQARSAFGISAVNGLECVTSGLSGIFSTTETPSPVSEEEAYLFEETLIESPKKLTFDPNASNIASACDALPSIAPTTSRQQKVTKDAIYKMMAKNMRSQRKRDEQLSSALKQMGKGLEILGNAIFELAEY
ncbi:unnamed protein product [Ceratitis capitata]|uniref:(Mediterranean fruit fly) hypothetical protein n=1 Tax=Ceratitis capitata TaxID=7213 RepID=A0A811U9A3_CERCA|nr:unnamed protein product [Ceratitis capitata]